MSSTASSFRFALFVALSMAAACVRDSPRITDAGPVPTDLARPDLGVMCTTTPTEDTVALCSDGCDNNGNSFVDCNDFACCSVRSDCPADTACGMPRPDAGPVMPCSTMGPETSTAACSDGCDNDGNRFVDCNDFACCDFRADCPMGTACYVMPPETFTIAQLQNRADAMHPASGTRVTVDQAGMVALTSRVLVGSAMPSSGSCRFAIWVGAAASGEFTAIQVQELITLPAGMSCFDLPVGKISDAFAPGDTVTSIDNATYNEFCAGPAGSMMGACTDFEQSNIFLGGTATLVRGAAGSAPTGTVVPMSDLVAAGGAPGARAVALEGGLLSVENVQIRATPDGMFSRYSAYLPAAPTVELDVLVSNFPATRCVRDHFTSLAMGTTAVPRLTGVLLPNFGRWTLRVRSEADVGGLTCP